MVGMAATCAYCHRDLHDSVHGPGPRVAVECTVLDSFSWLSSWILAAAVQSRARKTECIEMVAQD